jgi:hypothetical protein
MPDIRVRKPFSSSTALPVSREQRRALAMLAGAGRGLTEHFLLGYGISEEALSGLVLAGLAAVLTEATSIHRGVSIDIERIHITDAGRQALDARSRPSPRSCNLHGRPVL